MVEEAAGWIVVPDKGRHQTFQIHLHHGAFGSIVKMGVLHGAGSEHQAAAGCTSQNIVFFLKTAFLNSQYSIPDQAAAGIR